MSEKAIQEAVQDTLQAMAEFADADVVINDWHVLDLANTNAPYVIIENSDGFEDRQLSSSANTIWQLPLNLFEPFQQSNYGWKPTLDNLRDRRQAIVTKFRSAFRSPSGSGVTIDTIRNDSVIMPYYDQYIPEENMNEAIPVFLYQRIILECEEY